MNQSDYSYQQPQMPPNNKTVRTVIALLICVIIILSLITAIMAVKLLQTDKNNGGDADGSYVTHYGDDSSDVLSKETVTFNKTDYNVSDFSIDTEKSDEQLTVKEINRLVSASVVEITTEQVVTSSFFSQYITEGAGSGVIIDESGLIVTNQHVIDSARSVTVRLNDGQTYSASLIGADESEDIAILKIEASGLTACTFGDSDLLEVGDEVIAIGNPLGTLGGTVTNGIISATGRKVKIDGNEMTLLQTNAAISPGNSGGGLFNTSGRLIGIVNAKSSGEYAEGLGFAIPTNHAKSIIEDLINFGYVRGKVDLGANLIDIYSSYYLRYYGLSEYGVYIYSVENDSDARNAGLKAGDLILSVNEAKIDTAEQLDEIMENSSVGEQITFAIKRNGKNMTVKVKLTEYRPS